MPLAVPPLANEDAERVPALIVVVPVYVLAPARLQVPAPSLVTVPVVVPMIDAIEPPCAPPKVNANVAPVMVPALVSAIVPASPTMEDAAPNAIKPE